MKLREYQEEAVTKSVAALKEHGNTLLVAPTGSGKTVILSHIIKKLRIDKSIVVAHRDELIEQNKATFARVASFINSYIFNATVKMVQRKGVTFAMVQSLVNSLHSFDTLVDLLVIDEAHHIKAASYLKIIQHFRSINPNLLILGVTATPQRSDKESLGDILTNISYKITLKTLIDAGFLKIPNCKVIQDSSIDNIEKLFSEASDDAHLKIQPINKSIIKHLKDNIEDRKTIAFTSTVEHAHDLVDLCVTNFNIKADIITGQMPSIKRNKVIQEYKNGDTQILFNANVLTEGFDCPQTSCVVLLRNKSHKSAMLQMIGRGLRYHPEIKDCLVIDFGESLKTHGTLELTGDLLFQDKAEKTDVEITNKNTVNKEDIYIEDYELETLDCLPKEEFNTALEWMVIDEGKKCIMTSCVSCAIFIFYSEKHQKYMGGFIRTFDKTIGLLDLGQDKKSIKEMEKEITEELMSGGAIPADFKRICNAMKQSPLSDNQKCYIPEHLWGQFNKLQATIYLTAKFNKKNMKKKFSKVGEKIEIKL